MTRVMLCGARSAEDISMLVEEGVEGIGLITEVAQEIPCCLSREKAETLCRVIPPPVSSILIVTEESIDEICYIVSYVNPDLLQLHGYNSPEQVAVLKQMLPAIKMVKTLHIRGEDLVEHEDPLYVVHRYLSAGIEALLLDSVGEQKYGSTGKTLPWSLARRIRQAIYPVPLILAGGLEPGNVGEAIRAVRPFAVDAFSSVTEQGRLQRKKVRRFIRAVKGISPEDSFGKGGEEPCGLITEDTSGISADAMSRKF